MNCLRCNSPMHVEQYDDMLDTRDHGFYGMHCVMCGDIVDPLILEHRRNGIGPGAGPARRPAPNRLHQLESTYARISDRP